MSSEGSTLPSGSLSQGLALGLGPRLGVLPGEVGVTSAFPPHVQLLILFMASEDDDQFLPGLVLHHPQHAVQTGAAGEAPLLGERLGVGGVGAALDLEPHTRRSLFRTFCSRGQGS